MDGWMERYGRVRDRIKKEMFFVFCCSIFGKRQSI